MDDSAIVMACGPGVSNCDGIFLVSSIWYVSTEKKMPGCTSKQETEPNSSCPSYPRKPRWLSLSQIRSDKTYTPYLLMEPKAWIDARWSFQTLSLKSLNWIASKSEWSDTIDLAQMCDWFWTSHALTRAVVVLPTSPACLVPVKEIVLVRLYTLGSYRWMFILKAQGHSNTCQPHAVDFPSFCPHGHWSQRNSVSARPLGTRAFLGRPPTISTFSRLSTTS